jgi:hypothetical protein
MIFWVLSVLVVYVCSHVLICFLEVDLILVDCGLTGNTSVGFCSFYSHCDIAGIDDGQFITTATRF